MNTQAALYALIAALAVSLPVALAVTHRGLTTAGERIVREARRAGRTATATLQSSRFLLGDPTKDLRRRRNSYWVSYQYQVDGVDYVYRARTLSDPPQTITLYYPEGHPDQAVPESDRTPGKAYSFWTFLPLILWAAFYYLLSR